MHPPERVAQRLLETHGDRGELDVLGSARADMLGILERAFDVEDLAQELLGDDLEEDVVDQDANRDDAGQAVVRVHHRDDPAAGILYGLLGDLVKALVDTNDDRAHA